MRFDDTHLLRNVKLALARLDDLVSAPVPDQKEAADVAR